MNRRGSVLVIVVLFVLAFGLFSKLVFDVGRWLTIEQKLQITADAMLLSSLRVRAESLQTIADRWVEIGQNIVEGFPNGSVLVPAVRWTQVQLRAEDLRRALGGYRGRVSAVMSVVADANGVPRTAGSFIQDDAQDLGLTAQTLTIRNELGQTKSIAAGWYRRNWLRDQQRPQPPEQSQFQMTLRGPANLPWSPNVFSRGGLRWDVNETLGQIQTRGNGGFPGRWSHVLEGAVVNPNRFALFQGELLTNRREP